MGISIRADCSASAFKPIHYSQYANRFEFYCKLFRTYIISNKEIFHIFWVDIFFSFSHTGSFQKDEFIHSYKYIITENYIEFDLFSIHSNEVKCKKLEAQTPVHLDSFMMELACSNIRIILRCSALEKLPQIQKKSRILE